MQKKVVITGVNGFVGHHLARELSSQGVSVVGVSYEDELFGSLKGIVDEYFPVDLVTEWPDVGGVDSVIHLAGFAAIGPSFDAPQKYINGNSAMVTNLCEYYLKQETKPRIIIVSSGTIYSPDQSMPIKESGEIGYNSPYAVSKILNENQAKYYKSRGLDCIVVRPFNHIGTGQAEGFLLPDLYKQLSESASDNIQVGNLETKRDYTDVRDIVRAYAKLALAPGLNNDLYNVSSGRSLSGTEILDVLKRNMNRESVTTTIDESKIRPNDIMEIVGDSSRLQEEIDWRPEIAIDQTIADFVASKS